MLRSAVRRARSLLATTTAADAQYSPSVTSYDAGPDVRSVGGYEKMVIYVGSCFAGAGVIAVIGAGLERSRLPRLS